VKTSDIKNAGTDANVRFCVYGKKGKSEEIPLDNKGDNFEQNAVDHFKVDMEDVGTPYKMRVYHDNSGRAAGWHLEKVWRTFGISLTIQTWHRNLFNTLQILCAFLCVKKVLHQ